MKVLFSCLLLLLTIFTTFTTLTAGSITSVPPNTSFLQNFVSNSPTTLIQFYAPWCYHCKLLEPELEIAATVLKHLSLRNSNIQSIQEFVSIGKVNCDGPDGGRICGEIGVTGLPTLVLFRRGTGIGGGEVLSPRPTRAGKIVGVLLERSGVQGWGGVGSEEIEWVVGEVRAGRLT